MTLLSLLILIWLTVATLMYFGGPEWGRYILAAVMMLIIIAALFFRNQVAF